MVPGGPAGDKGYRGVRVADPEQVRLAFGRLVNLATAVRSGGEGGDRQTYADGFADAILKALDGVVAIELTVDAAGIHCGGKEIAGQGMAAERMVRGLVMEGVRGMYIPGGIVRQELIVLGDLLAQDWVSRGEGERDLQTRAWGAKLTHAHVEVSLRQVVSEDQVGTVRGVDTARALMTQLSMDQTGLAEGAEYELASVVARLRHLEEEDALGSQVDALAEVREAGPWSRGVDRLRVGGDVPDDLLARVFYDAARSAPDPAFGSDLISELLPHISRALRVGEPDHAAAIVRRLMLLVDPECSPAGPRQAAVTHALRGVVGAPAREAAEQGWERNPVVDSWKGPLFTLAQCGTLDDLDEIVTFGRAFENGALRQAIADGLMVVVERAGVDGRALLSRSRDFHLPIVLRSLRRRADPTLAVPILARAGHQDPEVREVALMALREQRSPRIQEVARKLLSDPARPVRMEALRYVSVYRDRDAAPFVMERMKTATPKATDEAELRALAIGYAHTTRGLGLDDLEAIAADSKAHKHPALAEAALHGLKAAGPPGREILDRLGRAHEELRLPIRELLGGVR